MSSKGSLIVLSAASGSGKTSLAVRLLREMPGVRFSISHTTRQPRSGERDGVEYFFVSEAEFKAMIEAGAFLEYAEVYGHFYGTSREFVESQLKVGQDVLLDIDVQGAMKVREAATEAILVFVFAPSFEVLKDRLVRRGLDDERVIDRRLRLAGEEIRCYAKYDYVIINEDIEKSVSELKSIVYAARCRVEKRKQRAELILKTFASE